MITPHEDIEDLPFCELCGTHHREPTHGLAVRPPPPAIEPTPAFDSDQAGDEARDGARSFADQLNRSAEESGRSSYGSSYW